MEGRLKGNLKKEVKKGFVKNIMAAPSGGGNTINLRGSREEERRVEGIRSKSKW